MTSERPVAIRHCALAKRNKAPQSLAQSYCSPCGVSRERMNHHRFLFLYFALMSFQPSRHNLPCLSSRSCRNITSAEYFINRHVLGSFDWTACALCCLFGGLSLRIVYSFCILQENWSFISLCLSYMTPFLCAFMRKSWDSAVCIATGYGLDGLGSIPGRSNRFSSTPQRPHWLCSPPNLLSNGYRRLFPRGKSSRGVKLTTHLHLAPRSRMVELYLYSPMSLPGIVLN
jgi:hypothetical protein